MERLVYGMVWYEVRNKGFPMDKSFYGETGVCTLWMRSETRNKGFPMDRPSPKIKV